MNRILAVDYGARRCGLALSDLLHISVNPQPTCAPQALLGRIQTLVETGELGTVLLGYPLDLRGGDTHSTEAVRKLKQQLNERFPTLELVLWDERFTSVMARRALHTAGLPRRLREDKSRLDTQAAVQLLQDYLRYLDEQRRRASQTD